MNYHEIVETFNDLAYLLSGNCPDSRYIYCFVLGMVTQFLCADIGLLVFRCVSEFRRNHKRGGKSE